MVAGFPSKAFVATAFEHTVSWLSTNLRVQAEGDIVWAAAGIGKANMPATTTHTRMEIFLHIAVRRLNALLVAN